MHDEDEPTYSLYVCGQANAVGGKISAPIVEMPNPPDGIDMVSEGVWLTWIGVRQSPVPR